MHLLLDRNCLSQKLMRYSILGLVVACLSCPSISTGRQAQPRDARRSQLLRELKKCETPGLPYDCDEMSVVNVAQLYEQGDTSVLPKLMDVAPHSDGALSAGLGSFFGDLLCHKPLTFLRAVSKRPRSEQDNLLFLAVAGDGGGMGCRGLDGVRHKLKTVARNRSDRLANLARRCLAQMNKHNQN